MNYVYIDSCVRVGRMRRACTWGVGVGRVRGVYAWAVCPGFVSPCMSGLVDNSQGELSWKTFVLASPVVLFNGLSFILLMSSLFTLLVLVFSDNIIINITGYVMYAIDVVIIYVIGVCLF